MEKLEKKNENYSECVSYGYGGGGAQLIFMSILLGVLEYRKILWGEGGGIVLFMP